MSEIVVSHFSAITRSATLEKSQEGLGRTMAIACIAGYFDLEILNDHSMKNLGRPSLAQQWIDQNPGDWRLLLDAAEAGTGEDVTMESLISSLSQARSA